MIPRAEMLAELMRLRFSIAVAGSHGKTTTTSMIALVLERAGLDPTAVIGGRLSAFGSNARLGRGEYMVAEADESDRSFLMLWPSIAVVTNIDREHMESYGSFADLQQAFVDFANKVPFYGSVIACADDAELGSDPAAHQSAAGDLRAGGERREGLDGRRGARRAYRGERRRARRVRRPVRGLSRRRDARERLGELRSGRARAATTCRTRSPPSRWLTASGSTSIAGRSALADFHGAERRFERHGEADGVLVVDDYGHHPTEIAAVLAAARATLGRRLVVAFQPHRYTRTQQLMDAFGPALHDADEIVLTDIYAASEEPIAGVTVDALGRRDASGLGSARARRAGSWTT